MDDARGQLTPYLQGTEVLLWTGHPDPAVHLSRNDLFVIPFSLLWAGFAIFWTSAALAGDASVPLVAVGLAFVALGLYLVVGRFVAKARRKRRTVYGLTDQRALVAVGAGALSQTSVQQQRIDQQRSRAGTHLTVTFGNPASGRSAGAIYANTGLDFFDRGGSPLAFYDVADVAGLVSALRRIA